MDYDTWEPIYLEILADFGFDRAADERARDHLADLLETRYDPTNLDFERRTVAVAGAGPSLEADLALVRDADVVVAASDAARRLRQRDVTVDCMVTDLDKTPETARTLTAAGVPVAVHAHGDNVAALTEHVPTLDHAAVLPTTQAEPTAAVYNFGGFTDGDRAAFLADARGAARLTFPGWDFDDPDVSEVKARKLAWAERLLLWLERRRGERFAVLDGRRESIDDSMLP
ncbi:MAG: 6-hydroxymethylpterin diphosphokinase MptE-like protein [Haloarculaceae archaeon]